jgi:hypothetical protein
MHEHDQAGSADVLIIGAGYRRPVACNRIGAPGFSRFCH